MGKMFIFATDLVQITAATGSQIRMEVYAKAGEKMARYSFWQDVQRNVESQIDLITIDATDDQPSRSAAAKKRIRQLGESDPGNAVSGYGDDVNQFTGGKPLAPASLTFLDTRSKSNFVVSLKTTVGGNDPTKLISFSFKGTADASGYGVPIPGKIMLTKGRWPFLIDL